MRFGLYYDENNELARKTAMKLKKHELYSEEEPEYMIALGGDGTFIACMRKAEVPVLPVNCGKLGAIAEIGCGDVETAIKMIENGNFNIVDYPTVSTLGKRAVNEVLIAPRLTGLFIRYELHLSQVFLWEDGGDGLLISTPLGSTGYNFSAKGPVLLARAFVLCPLNSMFKRPKLVSERCDFTIVIKGCRCPCEVIFDGQERCPAPERIEVREGEPVRVIRFGKDEERISRFLRKVSR